MPADRRRLWDFSADGVRRSLTDSLDRLGLDLVDLLLIHDPEDHQAAALGQAYPAVRELRAQGVIGALGVGSRQWRVLHRFVRETEVDAVMLAGRYTLPAPARRRHRADRRGGGLGRPDRPGVGRCPRRLSGASRW